MANRYKSKPKKKKVSNPKDSTPKQSVSKKGSVGKSVTPELVKKVRFETTRNVSLRVDRVLFEGTKFSFSPEVVEDRKRILRESYGEDIIKQNG